MAADERVDAPGVRRADPHPRRLLAAQPKRALASPCSLSRYTRYVSVVVVPVRRVRRSTSTRCVGLGYGALKARVARTVPRRSPPAGSERTCTVAVTWYVPGPGCGCVPGSVPETAAAPSRLAVQVPDVRQAYRTGVPGRRQVAGAGTAITGVPLPAHRLTAARSPSGPRRTPAGAHSVAGPAAAGAGVRASGRGGTGRLQAVEARERRRGRPAQDSECPPSYRHGVLPFTPPAAPTPGGHPGAVPGCRPAALEPARPGRGTPAQRPRSSGNRSGPCAQWGPCGANSVPQGPAPSLSGSTTLAPFIVSVR